MTYYPIAASPGHQLALAQHSATPQVAAMIPAPGALRADKLEVSIHHGRKLVLNMFKNNEHFGQRSLAPVVHLCWAKNISSQNTGEF